VGISGACIRRFGERSNVASKRGNPAEKKARAEGETVAQDKGDTKREDFLERMKAKKSKRGK